MVNLMPTIKTALLGIPGVKVDYFYPQDFNTLPAISIYEASNVEHSHADDREYTSSIAVQVDIWGHDPDQVLDLAIAVNAVMQSLDFSREFAADLFEPDTLIYRKTMRFSTIKGVD